jgi:hypothetical protein
MLKRVVMTGAAILALWGTAAIAADPPAAARSNVSATAPQPAAETRGRKGYDAWTSRSDMISSGGPVGGAIVQAPVSGAAGAPAPMPEKARGPAGGSHETKAAGTNTNPMFQQNKMVGSMVD